MHEATQQAQKRFDNIWQQAQVALKEDKIDPAKMRDGQIVPVNYCLSTISRLLRQESAPLENIRVIMQALKLIAPHDYYYGLDALHISLIGCSARKADKAAFGKMQIQKIKKLLAETLPQKANIRMQMKGINLIGNQVFVQVLPIDRQWEHLRQRIGDSLTTYKEEPITYPDKSPIHLNIMRLTSIESQKLAKLHDFLADHRQLDFGNLAISSIEYLMTDFVVSDIEVYEEFVI